MWSISRQILLLTTEGLSRTEYFREVLGLLLGFTGGGSVELCLREGEEYRRYSIEASRDGKSTFHSARPDEEPGKAACIINLWSAVLETYQDSGSPSFSPGGSFWTGDAGGASLAVVPISGGRGERIGVLRVTSQEKDGYSKQDIERFEAVANAVGMGILNLRVQSALRERVKELTCLYGITKLVEQPGMTIEQILQGVAELLPPAWQYPEITAGRIVLDGRSYGTPGLEEVCHRMTSPIVIESRNRGVVEVSYSQVMPSIDEGPFLKEERSLLDVIAKQVSLIIERREAEESRARLEDQLRHADRLATIGQLAAGVAHELNEPLGNILGFAQLATKHEGLAPVVRADLDKIVGASLYAREVIKKLMLFARQTPPVKTQVNLNRVVEEGLSLLESRCEKQGIDLVRSLSADLPDITADAGQINQVLVNLIVNSIQAMPEGGTLRIETAGVDGSVLLRVADTGVGMSGDVMEKVFLPFYTTKDIDEGTGLGLAVVNGIVTSHGGFIKVDSSPGIGTTFEVRLPVSLDDRGIG